MGGVVKIYMGGSEGVCTITGQSSLTSAGVCVCVCVNSACVGVEAAGSTASGGVSTALAFVHSRRPPQKPVFQHS